MPKVQGVLRKSGARDNRNVRHQSCEGCRRRKMKCSRTMPCIACEVRGQNCVWLDSKPTHGLLQPSLHETQAEIVRLEKVIKQLQALVAEKDGCPLPLPDDLVPPTPPHALDALPQGSPPSDPQQDFDLAAAVAHFGGASSLTSAPSWVPSSWTRVDDGSAPSPSLPLEALPWARTHVDEPRQLYDSTVSYATLLANPVPALHGPLPGAAAAAASATTVIGAGSSPTITSPSSWAMAHERATTWPSPSSSRRGDFVVDSAFAPRSSSSSFSPHPALSSATLSYSHLAPLPLSPAPVSPPHRLPGRETISAMVHGVRVQAPPAAADALGLSIESTQGAGGSMRKMDALAWSLVMGSLAQ
ncbi:uncharacterized protein RHOBADRAFT_56504 [Rhodotorula graminis WP1]|uniref:Zn(2)-C6 fungal-type domain-containing protein n=1 Tax=Rhodotorula graminis (strain WP1) TaxID=578459 RepID=A0A0P9EQ76_RHOGW|nr:uncharacterized protein RHOBADRAFT_56504 [Rhodotorula graminis WP1]KPV71671.1 hypothetical protein RHOBADRAFT_56504 [Rhodotorula graminis WP1]